MNASTPLFGGLLAWLWLKDRPTSARWLGLAIGFLGVAVLTLGRDPNAPVSEHASTWGILACLLATFFYGLAACFAQRHLRSVSALTTACGSMVGATTLLALPTWWLWPAQMPPWQAWASIAALGIVCTAAAYALYFKLNMQIGATKAMSVTYLIPVFASLLGAELFGESLSTLHVLSGGVILSGTALASGFWVWPKNK
ncbi:MAG: EamA family transporter [Actinobacteria bacterium]|nr:EamA family transporter [Actinomycetota bacterium]